MVGDYDQLSYQHQIRTGKHESMMFITIDWVIFREVLGDFFLAEQMVGSPKDGLKEIGGPGWRHRHGSAM